MVAGFLSPMSMGSVSHVPNDKKLLVNEVHRLARLGFRLEDSTKGGFKFYNNSESSLVVEVDYK